MVERLWPRLWHVHLSVDVLADIRLGMLEAEARVALMELVACCAAALVWTYTAPSDGSIEDDDEMLARIARLSPKRWLKLRPKLAQFFRIENGRWHLAEDWIAIDEQAARFAIPQEAQRAVLRRAGRVCAYCGDTTGPFDFDHIMPVSKGGTNDPSNLTLACASCNRSKGGKTLKEWMDWR